MKRFLFVFLLLTVFGGVSSVGFLNLNHGSLMVHGDCFASAVARTTCPDEANTLAFLNFHANAIKDFSSVLLGVSITSLFLLVLALAYKFFLLVLRSLGYCSLHQLISYVRCRNFLKHCKAQFLYALFYWLSLHEHSPTFS